jgi:hypothetical protein
MNLPPWALPCNASATYVVILPTHSTPVSTWNHIHTGWRIRSQSVLQEEEEGGRRRRLTNQARRTLGEFLSLNALQKRTATWERNTSRMRHSRDHVVRYSEFHELAVQTLRNNCCMLHDRNLPVTHTHTATPLESSCKALKQDFKTDWCALALLLHRSPRYGTWKKQKLQQTTDRHTILVAWDGKNEEEKATTTTDRHCLCTIRKKKTSKN